MRLTSACENGVEGRVNGRQGCLRLGKIGQPIHQVARLSGLRADNGASEGRISLITPLSTTAKLSQLCHGAGQAPLQTAVGEPTKELGQGHQ